MTPKHPVSATKALVHRLADFWSTDRSLRVFVVVLGLLLFVVAPLYKPGPVGTLVLQAAFTLVLVSGVLAATRHRMLTYISAVLVCGGVAFRWAHAILETDWLKTASLSMTVVSLVLLCAAILVHVMREGPITVHRIEGAIGAYMLLGLTWAQAYELLLSVCPDAIRMADGLPPTMGNVLYFSFITLTTIGYGDITPVHPFARSLVMMEGLTGQLFPAILIARLVSMELYHRQRRHEKSPGQ